MQQLEFYAYPQSPYCEGVELLMEELGLSYHYHEVSLVKGEHRHQAYLAVNPLGRVPAVKVDGAYLSESRAIMRYLARRLKAGSWYPDDLLAAAKVDRMLDYSVVQVGVHASVVAWHRFFAPKLGLPQDQKLQDHAANKLARELPILEGLLADQTYLAGSSPTLADLGFLPFVNHMKLADISCQDFPRLQAWWEAMVARPSWQSVKARHRIL